MEKEPRNPPTDREIRAKWEQIESDMTFQQYRIDYLLAERERELDKYKQDELARLRRLLSIGFDMGQTFEKELRNNVCTLKELG